MQVYIKQSRNIYKEETTWQTLKKMDDYTKLGDDGELIYLV
jgi:hypothetical protein